MRRGTNLVKLLSIFSFAALLLAGSGVLDRPPAAKSGKLHLVMVEEASCYYCKLWHEEVGRTYSATAEGRRAPLVRLDIASRSAKRFARVVYTPTFILVRTDGREIGRIVGYPGADHFWGELGRLLTKAGGGGKKQAPSSATQAAYGQSGQ